MLIRIARITAGLIFFCLTLPAGLLWAQNENETVGFQSNHIYESGHFGENIDVLNGGLMLTIPIGPQYQVNTKLGYQLTLAYNSKVWDTSHYNSGHINPELQVLPYNESPVGLGFSLHLGRIFVDSRYIFGCVPGAESTSCWMQSWKWVAPDGSQHEFYYEDFAYNPLPPPLGVLRADPFHPVFTQHETTDRSYVLISGPSLQYCTGGGSTGCFRVETPDGLTYTLSQGIACHDPSTPDGEHDAKDALLRSINQSY
jgi:hypothetical protein